MTYKHTFEIVNKILNGFMKAVDPSLEEKPFESKSIVFEGDFCQILPVVIKENYKNIVESYLQRSIL
jgi:hypothetical protein